MERVCLIEIEEERERGHKWGVPWRGGGLLKVWKCKDISLGDMENNTAGKFQITYLISYVHKLQTSKYSHVEITSMV